MTFTGLAVTLVGAVALAFAVVLLLKTVSTNTITTSGQPGEAAIAGFTVAEGYGLDSPGGVTYDLWQVQPQSPESQALNRRDVVVTGPGGVDVMVRNSQVSSHLTVGSFSANTFASFTAAGAGVYTITISPDAGFMGASLQGSSSTPVDVVVTEGKQFFDFFSGIFGTVGLMFLGIGGLIVGGGLHLAGIIWWSVVRTRNKSAAYSGSGSTDAYYRPLPGAP